MDKIMSSNVRTPRLRGLNTEPSKLNSTFHTRNLSQAIHSRNTTLLIDTSGTQNLDLSYVKADEKQEINSQLKLFKQNLDKIKSSGTKGSNFLSHLKQELDYLEMVETKKQFWQKQNQSRIKHLEKEITETLDAQNQENKNRDRYLHLLDRMKETKIHLEIKYGEFDGRLNKQDLVVKHETRKSQNTNEAKSRGYIAYKEFKHELEREIKERDIQKSKLETSVKEYQEESLRKEDYKQRREEMLERAVIEDRSQRDVLLRESLMFHRLWYNALTLKYNREVQKSSVYEDAYQKIKITTGHQDIATIVENFLTKEQTYKSLMSAVKQKEIECNEYRHKIDQMQKNVENIKVADNLTLNLENQESLKTIRKELTEIFDKKQDLNNKKVKIQTWLKKILSKMRILGIDIEYNDSVRIKDFILTLNDKVASIVQIDKAKVLGNVLEGKKKKMTSIIEEIPKDKLLTVFESGEINSVDLIGYEDHNS